MQPTWKWELTDPRRNGGAGDIAKLFKNEGIEAPGHLANGAPPERASLLAREVIQNSWDAASELQSKWKSEIDCPKFGIEFEFIEVAGEDSVPLKRAMNISWLVDQHGSVSTDEQRKLGLARPSFFDEINGAEAPLRLLKITESGTTGMYGAFEGAKSKMFLALISVGYTVKGSGSGGSYGYGKAGLIAGSSTRTVYAYSCFAPQEDDVVDGKPVTRRFLGMSYWGQHSNGSGSFTGFARFGDDEGEGVIPLVNEAADEMAERLGITNRDPANSSDFGTTFLLVDPVVEPEDLCNAIERNWWAAMEEDRFTPFVIQTHADGTSEKTVPRPRKNPAVASFVRAYEIATVPQDNNVAHESGASLGKLPGALGAKEIGRIGMLAELDGWSFAQSESEDTEESVEQTSLVALLRGPLMTVTYFKPKNTGRPPYVRGVFVADDEIDDLLRQSEPKAHDAWVTKMNNLEDAVNEEAPKVASETLKAVSAFARKFQSKLTPPLPDIGDLRLDELADLFKGLMKGGGRINPPPPRPPLRDVSINVSASTEFHPSEPLIRVVGTAKLRLSENFTQGDQAPANIRLLYRFVEDERVGEACPISLLESDVSLDNNGQITVNLGRESLSLKFETEYYDSNWSGRLDVSAEVSEKFEEGVA